jgi:hypothetical protein
MSEGEARAENRPYHPGMMKNALKPKMDADGAAHLLEAIWQLLG